MFSHKRKVLSIILFVLAVLLLIPMYVKNDVAEFIVSDIERLENKEFAIVLGAAIDEKNQPGSYLKLRLDDALRLFEAGKVQKIVVSGDNGDEAHDEVSVMNNYLIQHGVPQDKIYGDYAGFDTYSTMERASKIFEIKSAIIISQAFHLPRAVYIARQKGIKAAGYATDSSYGQYRYFIRENLAIVKSYLDCKFSRKSKFYGEKIDTNGGSNIIIKQL